MTVTDIDPPAAARAAAAAAAAEPTELDPIRQQQMDASLALRELLLLQHLPLALWTIKETAPYGFGSSTFGPALVGVITHPREQTAEGFAARRAAVEVWAAEFGAELHEKPGAVEVYFTVHGVPCAVWAVVAKPPETGR